MPCRLQVAVTLTALEKREVQHKVVLEVQDLEGVLGVVHAIPIAIKGEAYKIETLIKFPQVRMRVRVCERSAFCCPTALLCNACMCIGAPMALPFEAACALCNMGCLQVASLSRPY